MFFQKLPMQSPKVDVIMRAGQSEALANTIWRVIWISLVVIWCQENPLLYWCQGPLLRQTLTSAPFIKDSWDLEHCH